MKIKSHLSFVIALLVAFAMLISTSHAAQVNVQEQCKNITPQQRQMASAAGYDVDSMCSSFGSMANNSAPVEDIQNVLPRGSQIIKRERENLSNQPRIDYSNKQLKKGLSRYGYELFAGSPTTFAPVTDIPIPVNYMMGPGDTVQIQLLGKTSDYLELMVSRDGVINFPELGPISLIGLNFSEAKQLIQQKVNEQMIGVRASISLGELRSIRIYILGEAFKPGSYTVSSLSTMTNALFVSGGITEVGSLRNIQLKRQGKVVNSLDLYDLLQKGDTSHDQRLLPGDVIYIPPVGATVGIQGEVKRPAIYELKGNKRLKNLIRLAGGYSASAYPNVSYITRKEKSGYKTVIDVDLSQARGKNTQLKNGDLIDVSTVLETLENVVELAGTFQRPRAVKWYKGMKLSNVIGSIQDFKENTDLNIALIIRKTLPLRNLSVIHFDLHGAIDKTIKNDITLQPLDKIITFKLYEEEKSSLEQELEELKQQKQEEQKIETYQITSNNAGILGTVEQDKQRRELEALTDSDNIRIKTLEPIMKRLREQPIAGQLIRIVDVTGNVRFPGSYPLTQSMKVRDLVLLAGGLKEASYLGNAEITRRDLTNSETATIEHINVSLANELTGNAQFYLQAKDKLAVYATPEYREHLTVTLDGEVRFPGEYHFKRGETLSQVVQRAGGFTKMAHIQAAIFTRRDLKQQEAKRLQELRDRLRADLAASNLEEVAAGKSGSVSNAEELLNALSETEAIGRLVIALDKIMLAEIKDIQLKDGDQLIIPMFRQEVSVLGEVQHATSHLYNDGWSLDDYLERSGGLTGRADDDRIYVVKADGSVFLPTQSGWLTHQNKMLSPGDTIVVPLDSDRIKSLTLWTSVSQVIYQLALGAAAISRL